MPPSDEQNLEAKILELTAQLVRLRQSRRAAFVPGESTVPYAGRVYDEREVMAAVRASLDFWLTLGPEGEAFEKELAEYLGVRHASLMNSGSSANLAAFFALTSSKLERPIRPADEVITVAAGFPTTVNPAILFGCVPVFVDVDLATANIDVSQLEAARSEKTRAVMIAHTLGNPFDVDAVLAFCRKHDLYLVEDNCDALGSLYRGKLTGTFGTLGTSSFYPPHHITMGEGGAVYTNDGQLRRIVESFRDWGRDCWCASGKDNTCGKRFEWDWPGLSAKDCGAGRSCNQNTLNAESAEDGAETAENAMNWPQTDADRPGQKTTSCQDNKKIPDNNTGCAPPSLPVGYDHKYVYSHIGFNLKPTDIQAAIGREQLRKLPGFIAARKRNWELLREHLGELEKDWHFTAATPGSDPSWFGFLMIMKEPDHAKLTALCRGLDGQKIGNRRLFGGNLLWQPAYQQTPHRAIGELPNTRKIALGGLFLGVYPGLTEEMVRAQADAVKKIWSSL